MAGPAVPEGALWRYYKGSSSPPDQGTSRWTQVTFDDSAWGPPSPTPFGYGDQDDATAFGDMSNAYASVFIRRTFVVADTATVTRLTLAADYDDGFVAHVNGTEVARRNMPAGPVDHATTAAAPRESSRSNDDVAQEKEFVEIDPSTLVSGTNVIAVSAHNVSLTSSDFTLAVEVYTNVNLVRGPFIQMPDSNRVAVVWRTDARTDTELDWGADANCTGGSLHDTNRVREHVVTLTGLAPGTSFFYRIRGDGVTLASNRTFQTAARTNQSFRFAVIGDFGASGPGMAAVASRVSETNVDLLLTVGDNIYNNGDPGNYDRFWFDIYATTMAHCATFPALGNHDAHLGNSHWMADYFVLPTNGPPGMSELVYSWDFGDAHFAVIDSNPIAAGDANGIALITTWLSNDLARTSRFWKFVLFHHPPYTSPSSHLEDANVQAHIVPLLKRYGVQAAFHGHNHFYERINPMNGVNYFIGGGSGRGLYAFSGDPPTYSAARYNASYSYIVAEVQGRCLDLRAYNAAGAQIDRVVLDHGAPFRMDGALDSHWGRATNGLVIFSAIRSNLLYIATQDAGEGSDHFLLINDRVTTNRPAPWGKAGTVMQWSAYLADENENGFFRWFGADEAMLDDPAVYRATTPGINANAPANNGVIEGTLRLDAHFGHWPTQLLVCAAPFASADGGALYAPAQCPANNGDGNIPPAEFLVLSTRALALDLPAASAGTGQTLEAGLTAMLDGSGSAAPSGFALAYAWSQVSGPAGRLLNPQAALAGFQLTNNVASNTAVRLLLTVNDTRFDATGAVTVTFTPMHDTDGDGLSDVEEATGLNNALTPFDPRGRTSATNLVDTDGDGINDAFEAYANTDPRDPSSFLAIAAGTMTPGGLVITWPSASNRIYALLAATNLLSGPQPLVTNIVATPALNTVTTPPSAGPFFRLRADP